MTGPRIAYSELNAADRAVFEADLARQLTNGNGPQMPEFYASMFHRWGIMCPHPIETRLYEGLYSSDGRVTFDESQWYTCNMCRCIVINR